jgi:hypothetical protein
MKTMSNGVSLCSAVVAIACSSDLGRAETWSCEQTVTGKSVQQVWIVAGDQLTTPSDERRYRILRNDQRVLIAFHKDWEYKIGGGTPLVEYVIVEKATGTLIDLNDSVLTILGSEYKDSVTPDVGVGHCSSAQP